MDPSCNAQVTSAWLRYIGETLQLAQGSKLSISVHFPCMEVMRCTAYKFDVFRENDGLSGSASLYSPARVPFSSDIRLTTVVEIDDEEDEESRLCVTLGGSHLTSIEQFERNKAGVVEVNR